MQSPHFISSARKYLASKSRATVMDAGALTKGVSSLSRSTCPAKYLVHSDDATVLRFQNLLAVLGRKLTTETLVPQKHLDLLDSGKGLIVSVDHENANKVSGVHFDFSEGIRTQCSAQRHNINVKMYLPPAALLAVRRSSASAWLFIGRN